MNSQNKKGILLINLGTPASLDLQDIKNYLGEFLMDPYVIGMPKPLRWLLVHGIVLNTRPKRSQKAYSHIWTPEGSPLLVNTRRLTERLQSALGPGYQVEFAMRYGEPSITAAVARLTDCESILAVPLYPQYSESATQTAVDEVKRRAPYARALEPFYSRPEFIEPMAQLVRDSRALEGADHLLLSYHGLPERHIRKLDQESHCLTSSGCCDRIDHKNSLCYRAQCFETSRLLCRALDWPLTKTTTSFQSRFGPTRWIGPSTQTLLEDLPQKGVLRLAVACPSFVSDCLETLEEIGIAGKESFLKAGGTEFHFVPCLNYSESWVRGLATMVTGRS